MQRPSLPSLPRLPSKEGLKRLILGPPERIPRRVLTFILVGSLALSITGIWLAATSEVSAGSSSLPYLKPILGLATSTWIYVLMLAWVCRRVLIKRDRMYAEQAANVTGWAARSVRRLAYEAKSPDGTTRVISTSEDEPEEIRQRILEAPETGEDDTMSLNPEAVQELDSDQDDVDDDRVQEYEELVAEYEELVQRASELDDDLGAGLEDVLDAEVDPGKVGDALASDQDRVAPIELLADDDREDVDDFAEQTDELDEVLEEISRVEDEMEALEAELLPAPVETDDEDGADRDADHDDQEDDVDADRDDWRERMKLLRLDVASTLDIEDLAWNLLVPAAATIALILIAVQLWIQPWLYPPIFAAGLMVGTLNYLRVNRKRTKRLEALREDRETVNWSDLSILIKEIEVPETTVYFAWMGGRRYAHDDREEFADELSLRAYELVNDVEVSPSIMEKQATQLERMQPDLHGFRDQEKEQIMTWMLEFVEEHGLVPKSKLIEDAVEYDIEARRWGPGKRGKGYDPELVRAAYRDLVPASLVEQEIPLQEGGDETLTAVRHRSDPLPPEYGAVRAQFSSQFSNYARWDPMYKLPDVDDQLDEEPIYADTLGYRGEA